MENEEHKQEKAKEIAKAKISFIRQLIGYIGVMIILAVINNVTNPGGYQWWLWPAGFMGLFTLISFLRTYAFHSGKVKSLEDRLIQKEMEKMDGKEQ